MLRSKGELVRFRFTFGDDPPRRPFLGLADMICLYK